MIKTKGMAQIMIGVNTIIKRSKNTPMKKRNDGFMLGIDIY